MLVTPLNLSQTDVRENGILPNKGIYKFGSHRKSSFAGKEPVGLFALLEVATAIEEKPKTINEAKKGKSCGNKFCQEVRQQGAKDDGWTKKKINSRYVWFCKKCSIAFRQKQFCEYCKQIYQDLSNICSMLDGIKWIECETCKRWIHVACEAKHGCKDIETLKLDPHFVYFCSECTKQRSSGRKNSKKENGRVVKTNTDQPTEDLNCRRSCRQHKRPPNNNLIEYVYYDSNNSIS
jgi:hypothetical protein